MHQPVLSVNGRSVLILCMHIFVPDHCQTLHAKVGMQACILIPEPNTDNDEVEMFHMTYSMKAHMSSAASLR